MCGRGANCGVSLVRPPSRKRFDDCTASLLWFASVESLDSSGCSTPYALCPKYSILLCEAWVAIGAVLFHTKLESVVVDTFTTSLLPREPFFKMGFSICPL